MIAAMAMFSQGNVVPSVEVYHGDCVSDLFIVAGVDHADAITYEKLMLKYSIPVSEIRKGHDLILLLAGVMSDSDRQKVVDCFSPDRVEYRSQACDRYIPCNGFGTCRLNSLNGTEGYTCFCFLDEGRYGPRCEKDICNPNECHNGGTCAPKSTSFGFTCTCPVGYTGELCEERINHCEDKHCLNDAVCENKLNTAICHCAIGYYGETCETKWLTYSFFTGISDMLGKLFDLQKKRATGEVSYKFYPEAKNWYQAKDICRQNGGELAMIRSADEQARVLRVRGAEKRFIWVGATDEGHEGQWLYVNEDGVSYADWPPGEPNNNAGNENCLSLWANRGHFIGGKWNDHNCNTRLPFVCELNLY